MLQVEATGINQPTETRMCVGTTHRKLETQNASTAVSTISFKTPDDDQRRSKHVVYNVVLKKFKDLLCVCSNF
jgi:hypothetical protein